MKNKLKEFCKSLGIEVGIAPVKVYKDLENILNERMKKGYYTGLEEKDIKKRVDPKLTMENAKSIIVCLFPYFIGHRKDSNLSKYTHSIDYHIIVNNKLSEIANFLSQNIEGFEYKTFVDNGPLVDRHLANISGLGYFGINNNIINDKYGSYVFIGYMLNNYEFEIDLPLNKTCIKCGECIKKCPGGAILGNFEIDFSRCFAYITQKKGELSDFEKTLFEKNKSIFGCDICQDVCYHNTNIKSTEIDEFRENIISNLDYEEVANMSNKEFKRAYGNRSFSWRGKNIIIRNLELVKKIR
ncbi:tRNA epoxyqueuosine(34) reductase QueG [Alkalithermobacter paradoxus]|uniref:Epoxyqueuosine reductase n=1 Tax=Alkalithermobacter paradoxus TaxID=29349 RepID=A0A1V4I8C7_9FIRM|nr:epoxyqueuosine reductase [[Clostridium] thermoalcaliphilum]